MSTQVWCQGIVNGQQVFEKIFTQVQFPGMVNVWQVFDTMLIEDTTSAPKILFYIMIKSLLWKILCWWVASNSFVVDLKQ